MKVKLLSSDAKAPTMAYQSDAGFDVYSPIDTLIIRGTQKQIKLGIAIEVGQDEVAIMSERSGMAIKSGLTSVGNIVDSGYRGEVSIILANIGNKDVDIHKGDKIGQIVVCKLGERKVEVVDELTPSERGENAHGSSGKQFEKLWAEMELGGSFIKKLVSYKPHLIPTQSINKESESEEK